MIRFALSCALMLALAAPALAGDGVQITTDAGEILVNKDVGTERWAIRLDLSEDHPLNVTGNIFKTDGSPPVFVQCDIRDIQGSADTLRDALFSYSCFGANRCPVAPCSSTQWEKIGDVQIRGSFFLP